MASSKLMPSTASTSSLKSDHRRNPINRSESNPKPELYLFQSHESVLIDAENDLAPGSMVSLDGLFRNTTVGRAGEINSGGGAVGRESYFLNSEITLLDAAGAITPITDAGLKSDVPAPLRRKTAEDVWREIVAGGQSEEEGKVECKEEVMDEVMTLEDFLVKAGAVDEAELMADMDGQVKLEPGLSGEMFSFESPYMSRQGSLESVGMMGYGDGTVGNVGGRKRRGANVFEPLDKATQQRQKRMIKNRESAARSRERKQAYQNELESMAVRLEEENEQLLKEKAERTRARHKMLMENIIPVEEKRRPAPAPAPARARSLRRVRSMLW